MRIMEIQFAMIFLVFGLSGIGVSLIAWGRSDSWQKRESYLFLAGGLGFFAGLSFSIGIAIEADLFASTEILGFLPFMLLISLFFTFLLVFITYSNLKASKGKHILLRHFQGTKDEEYE